MINNHSHRHRDPGIVIASAQDRTAELVERLISLSSQVLIKKLALNDRQWAIWDSAKGRWKSNQAGPLLPKMARSSAFFPEITPDPIRPHNLSTLVHVYWPTTGKLYRSNFTWYSEKGEGEHHFTINPRTEFADISPASYLLIFKPKVLGEPYQALTVDSADDDLTEYINEIFGITTSFTFGVFETKAIDINPLLTKLRQLASQLIAKLEESEAAFEIFVSGLRRRSPQAIAAAALEQWKRDTGILHFNPYFLDEPGDVLFDLTRVREFALYKEDEAATYGAQLVRALLGGGRATDRRGIVISLIERFDIFYDICKSAKQARASRAGGSFEIHMTSALKAGGVPHSPQFVFDGSKPDFILPSGAIYENADDRRALALVLTLKTTIRERWKQVVSESTGCPIFLATLDESVPGKTLDKLENKGITLVVPEQFKKSEFAEYAQRASVITYFDFFEMLLRERSEPWLARGIPCFGIGP
ncbi:MAG: type II restriction endonuclease [Pseudomonadota bacterium]